MSRERAQHHAARADWLLERLAGELGRTRSDSDSLGITSVATMANAHATLALALLSQAQGADDTPTKGDAPPEG